MYDILIVEDEMLVTVGIVNSIDWREAGFNAPHTAANGKQAWELMGQIKFDLIMTDIKMPEMDGLDLVRTMRDHNYSAEVIILSSYTDFEYVSEALELQTCSYLHKPAMMPADIVQAVKKAAARREESKRQARTAHRIERLYLNSARKLKERLLLDLLAGSEVGDAQWKEVPLECDPAASIVAVVRFRNGDQVLQSAFKGDATLFAYAATNVIDEVLRAESGYESVCKAPDLAVVLLSGPSEGGEEKRNERFTTLSRVLRTYFQLDVEMALQTVPIALRRLSHAAGALLKVLGEREQRVPADRLIVVDGEAEPRWTYRSEEWLDSGWFSDSFPGVAKVEQIYRELERKNATYRQTLELSGMLLGMLLQRAASYPGVLRELYRVEPEMYSRLQELGTAPELKRYAIRLWETAEALIRGSHPQEIEKALQYVERNLHDQKLGLESAAAFVNVSRAHFSRLFKEHTGETFHQYVTKSRIRRAEHLARTTDLKMYEIAEKVGYPSSKYFSKLYKKLIGKQLSQIRSPKKL